MTKRVCVTGGAGFIGSHLVDHCVKQGHEVVVVDDVSTGDPRNLQNVRDHIEFYRSDIRSPREMANALEGVEWVFHQAALPSVPRSMEEPLRTTDVTFMGTLNLLEQARKQGVQRVVYASSSSIYGNQPGQPRTESMVPAPESPYAASKQTCETFADIYSRKMDLHTVGLRYFNVFGPRQDPTSDYSAVIPSFVGALLSGNQAVIYGDGEQSRDFTYVKDVVEANLEAAHHGKKGAVYNVGYNKQTTVNELYRLIRSLLGVDREPRYDDPRPGDVRESQADMSHFRRDTDFEPRFSLEEGLEETVHWFRDHPDRLAGDEP